MAAASVSALLAVGFTALSIAVLQPFHPVQNLEVRMPASTVRRRQRRQRWHEADRPGGTPPWSRVAHDSAQETVSQLGLSFDASVVVRDSVPCIQVRGPQGSRW